MLYFMFFMFYVFYEYMLWSVCPNPSKGGVAFFPVKEVWFLLLLVSVKEVWPFCLSPSVESVALIL